jgi:hypothetical protein
MDITEQSPLSIVADIDHTLIPEIILLNGVGFLNQGLKDLGIQI